MGLFGNKTDSGKGNGNGNADVGDSFLYVGKEIKVKGSGRWWEGASFTAIIQDIRPSDDTIKIQYTRDGGYKRWKREDLLEHLIKSGQGHTEFGRESFEWYYEQYAPDKTVVNDRIRELDDLRQQIKAAARKGEFQEAHILKKNFVETQKHFQVEEGLKSDLQHAIQREDFLKAEEIKKKMANNAKTWNESDQGAKDKPSLSENLKKAGKRALGGGLAGATAMIIQVSSLMWMRTTMNYQYRYGTSTTEAMRTLYKDGGIPRFYRGITPALLQGPLSRFGDTAANTGFLMFMDSYESTRNLPAAVKTIGASATAASWRIFLTPIDTVKTILQVEGKEGLNLLFAKARVNGPSAYYHGAMAAAAATFVGHYPWFATFNTLQANIPVPDDKFKKLGRNAFIGFVSSVTSDCVSNSLRVVKTYRQTNPEKISYADTIKKVVEKDGWMGLFGRGLKTRILANGTQGLMFSVLWKHFDEKLRARGA